MASDQKKKWEYYQIPKVKNNLPLIIKKYNKNIDDDTSISGVEKTKNYLPVISFHKLRHTSATLLVGQNTDIRTVSARLGHAQTSTTMNIYVHGLNSLDVKAASSLEDLLIKEDKKLYKK